MHIEENPTSSQTTKDSTVGREAIDAARQRGKHDSHDGIHDYRKRSRNLRAIIHPLTLHHRPWQRAPFDNDGLVETSEETRRLLLLLLLPLPHRWTVNARIIRARGERGTPVLLLLYVPLFYARWQEFLRVQRWNRVSYGFTTKIVRLFFW